MKTTALALTLLVPLLLAAKKPAKPKGPSKAQCEKAFATMYRVAGLSPSAKVRAEDIASCEKSYSRARTDCMTKAKTVKDLAACDRK